MANEQLRQSLFGPSPQEVEMARRAQGRARDMQWAAMPAGRGPVAAAAGAGRMLGDAFGGPDPAQQKARLLQEAQQEVETSGVSLLSSPTDYYRKAIEAMEKRGLHDEAFSVYQILRDSETATREAGLKEREVGAKEVSAQASLARALKESEDSPESDIGKLSEDLREGRISQEEYDAMVAKKTYIRPPTDSALLALAKGQSDMATAIAGQTASREVAKSNQEFRNKVFRDAELAFATQREVENIRAARESGDTKFGSLAESRRAVASLFTTFAPGMAEDVNAALGIDVDTYDAVERSSKRMLANMVNSMNSESAGGNRLTGTAIQLLERAGPSVFLTNEGLAVVERLYDKSSQYQVDKANYLAQILETSPADADLRAALFQWERENAGNPKYTLNNADYTALKKIASQKAQIKRLFDQSKQLPVKAVKDTGEVVFDPRMVQKGQIYRYEGEYYKYDGTTLVPVR